MTLILARDMPLLDIEIARTGDGRTVTAYAATFAQYGPLLDDPQLGEYDEIIDRAAWNRFLAKNGPDRVQVIYHHGLNAFGSPLDQPPMPIGRAVEIRPDTNGLVTVTRYARTELADQVLELIRDGAIRAQSWRGPVFTSDKPRRVAGRTVVRRVELGLTEYGPTPWPANHDAKILAVRSSVAVDPVDELLERLTDDERAALAERLNPPAPFLTHPDEGLAETPGSTPPESRVGELDALIAEIGAKRRQINPTT